MNIKIFEYILKAFKNISEICNKVVDASDPKKYAEGVHALNQNVEETYAKMRELIEKDEKLSAEEKLEKLEKLAESQQKAMHSCEEAIKDNREHIAKIVAEVFAAIATCGISCVPKIIKKPKKEVEMIEEAKIDYIEAGDIE